MSESTSERPDIAGGRITAALLITLALQNAVPPFATDMYTPAFPQVTAGLHTTSTLIGLSLTTFFIGLGSGQIIGGALSDQRGRRGPIIAGGLICAFGGLACALAPSMGVLLVGRLLQGFGGGTASAVGRAVVVDLARGHVLARTMSLLQALGGLAPMIAPVAGGAIITHASWRAIFAFLTVFGLVMMAAAWRWIPESLPPELRHTGGLRRFASGIGAVLRIRPFVGFMMTSAFSGFCMFAYISNSSYVLQGQLGLAPMQFSLIFAANALGMVGVTILNTRLVGRFEPRQLIRVGLGISAFAVTELVVTVLVWDTALIPTCIGFFLLMSAQGMIFGNASALSLGAARELAGTASAVQGLVQACSNAVAAPLATSGGSHTAVPMIATMVVGVAGAWASLLLVAGRR